MTAGAATASGLHVRPGREDLPHQPRLRRPPRLQNAAVVDRTPQVGVPRLFGVFVEDLRGAAVTQLWWDGLAGSRMSVTGCRRR